MQKGMSKRAQVTVFVVIAVVIVALAGVSYLVVKNKGSDVPKTPEEVAFKTYMDGCSNACLRASLVDLGYNGGYYDLNGISNSDFFGVRVPYYLEEKQLEIISGDKVVSELNNRFVDCFSLSCLEDYESDYEISTTGLKEIKTSLAKDKVSVQMDYPITLTSNSDTTTIISSFKAESQVRLEKIYNMAAKTIALQMADPYNICLNCLDSIRERDITIDGYTWEDNTIVFMLGDYRSFSDEIENEDYEPYRWFFAVKYADYGCDNLPEDIDEYIKDDCEDQKAAEEFGRQLSEELNKTIENETA